MELSDKNFSAADGSKVMAAARELVMHVPGMSLDAGEWGRLPAVSRQTATPIQRIQRISRYRPYTREGLHERSIIEDVLYPLYRQLNEDIKVGGSTKRQPFLRRACLQSYARERAGQKRNSRVKAVSRRRAMLLFCS